MDRTLIYLISSIINEQMSPTSSALKLSVQVVHKMLYNKKSGYVLTSMDVVNGRWLFRIQSATICYFLVFFSKFVPQHNIVIQYCLLFINWEKLFIIHPSIFPFSVYSNIGIYLFLSIAIRATKLSNFGKMAISPSNFSLFIYSFNESKIHIHVLFQE